MDSTGRSATASVHTSVSGAPDRFAVVPAGDGRSTCGDCGHIRVCRPVPAGNVAFTHEGRNGGPLLNVSFYGTRGSTPCPCEDNRRYGANTACVVLEAPGHDPVILDLGTGLRFFGETVPPDRTFQGSALVTHLHWDHVQGLPFFTPILRPGARLDVYGPPQRGGSLDDAFRHFIRPPYFPVTVEELYGQMAFHDAADVDLEVNGAKVRVRPVPHVGENNGYRVEMGGVSVAYVSDHQMPRDGSHAVADSVLELCDGADLVIHDAQFTPAEFARKPHWGHCTIAYAVFVAREAGAKRLALFHHDPSRSDDQLDGLLVQARRLAEATSVSEVVAAYEGLTLSFGG